MKMTKSELTVSRRHPAFAAVFLLLGSIVVPATAAAVPIDRQERAAYEEIASAYRDCFELYQKSEWECTAIIYFAYCADEPPGGFTPLWQGICEQLRQKLDAEAPEPTEPAEPIPMPLPLGK